MYLDLADSIIVIASGLLGVLKIIKNVCNIFKIVNFYYNHKYLNVEYLLYNIT